MILPISAPDSISACAFAASASGNACAIDDLQLAAARTAATRFSRSARASATLRAVGLARSVEPVTVRRFIMMCRSRSRRGCPAGTRSARAGRRAPALQVRLDVVAADHVEHDVDAALAGDAPDLGDEVLRLVVDRVIGADRRGRTRPSPSLPAVVNTMAPKRLGELDRREADAAGAAVDQHRLAGGEVQRGRTGCTRR